MGRLRGIHSNWTSGELDPRLLGQVELKHYYAGADKMRNVLVMPQGGYSQRPGLRFVDEILGQIEALNLAGEETTTGTFGATQSVGQLWGQQQANRQHFGLSFIAPTSGKVTQAKFALANTSLLIATTAVASIYDDDNGSPGTLIGNTSGTTAINSSSPFTFNFGTPPDVNGGRRYWLIFSDTGNGRANISVTTPQSNYKTGTADTITAISDGSNISTSYELRAEIKILGELGVTGATITAPNGGSVVNLTDGDTATETLTTTDMGTTSPYVVFNIDLGSAMPILFVDVLQYRLTAGSIQGEVYLQVSNDAVAWTDVGEPFRLADTTKRDRRRLVDGTWRYIRLVRIGTADLTTAKFGVGEVKVWQATAGLSPAVLVTHNFSTFQRYLMVFTDRNMRVYDSGVAVADVPTPYTITDLYAEDELGIKTINWTSLDDTLLVFHESHRPRRFQRQGANYEWDPKAWVLNNLPTYDFGSGAEAVISDARGWPRCGTFFQGRLWMAGSTSRPQTLWASKSGDFEDFDTSTTADDFGIEVSADVDEVSAFFNIYAGRHLQLFANSGEFYVPVSDTQGVTPGNIILRRTTQIGSKRGVRVFEVEGATIFLSTTGTSLREFLFVDTEQAYTAPPISKLASHLLVDPVAMAFRKAQGLEKADYVWMVNSDGTLAAFCTLRQEGVNAMTLQLTAGSFLDCAVSRTDSYFVVERTIDGVTRRFLETFDDELLVDCGLWAEEVVSAGNGLDHLDGETAELVLDDMPAGSAVVAAGSVTFPRETREKWQAGLAWPYVDEAQRYRAFVRSVAIEGVLPDGTQVGKRKRLVNLTHRLYQTTALIVNGRRLTFRKTGEALLDQSIVPFTGDKVLRGLLGNGLQAQFETGIDEPGRFTVLATSYEVAV